MTFTIKTHGAPSPTIAAEYFCPEHGRFELNVDRTPEGDAPDFILCPITVDEAGEIECGCSSEWCISAPKPKVLSVPCTATVRGGDSERRPGMLDTRPLAEGMSMKEWKKAQKKITEERRYQQMKKMGIVTPKVIVG